VHLRDVVLFTTTLLAIVNPISSAVLFAAMAGRFAPGIQRNMANQSAFAVLVILLVCAWVGRPLLQVLGISVPMLQAAGGLILLLYGIRMVTVDELKLTPHHHHRRYSGDDVFEPQGSGDHHRRLRGGGAGHVADVSIGRSDRAPSRSDRA
jgi:small neutral amino acid transporter SnatA (MarC family)